MPSLSGKTILVTRAASQAEDFADLIRKYGGIPYLAPTIEISAPESWDACDKAITGMYMYDGLLFTSSNAVRFFFERLGADAVSSCGGKIICCVGEKTRAAIEECALQVTAMPEKFTAADLGRALRQEDMNGKAFLFPRGNLGNDTLPATLRQMGASVDAVTVYRTTRPLSGRLQECRRDLRAGRIDVVTFTSPSTFDNFVSFFPEEERQTIFDETRIASIGPVTSRAIEAAGFRIDIEPRHSTIESLVEAIINHFSQNNG